eukprot:13009657-Alexandrium_andersonii.AAC.1
MTRPSPWRRQMNCAAIAAMDTQRIDHARTHCAIVVAVVRQRFRTSTSWTRVVLRQAPSGTSRRHAARGAW